MNDPGPSYEYAFDPSAANDTAAAVYRFAREGGVRVLDLGSGPAIVSSHLKRADGKNVTCVDSSAERLEVARGRGVDRVVQADLETSAWADELAGESFDVIILADVLEHLRVPELPLRLIRERGLLTLPGRLVVSIPNVAHEAVAAELLSGRFRYRDAGLLDATHVRFFTHDSFVDLLEREGYVVTRLHRTTMPLEHTEMASLAADLPAAVRHQLASIPEGRTYQFVACAEPATEALELSRLRVRLDDVERDLDRLRGDAEALRVRSESEGGRLREQIKNLRRENQALERKLAQTYASRSWRYGRTLTRIGGGAAHPWRTLSRRLRRRRSGVQKDDGASIAAPGSLQHLELRADR